MGKMKKQHQDGDNNDGSWTLMALLLLPPLLLRFGQMEKDLNLHKKCDLIVVLCMCCQYMGRQFAGAES